MVDVTLENVGKIVAIVAAIYAVYKFALEVYFLKRSGLRENYDLVGKFIENNKWKDMHDYQLEYAYLALSGKEYEASTIRYFLSQKDPLKKLADFNNGRKYLVSNKEELSLYFQIF